jgi:hypothetical protein
MCERNVTPEQRSARRTTWLRSLGWVGILLAFVVGSQGAPVFTVRPAGNEGFDVLADGVVIAPVRLSSESAIQADTVFTNAAGLRLSGFHTRDPRAITFAADDFVSITVPAGIGNSPATWEPIVEFKLTLGSFDTNRWLAMFSGGPAPFHFLACSMPTAQVWHQRGWLNATPLADPFPLLQDVHTGSPEISCLWNRNWSYLCPLGAHPIPMIGLWDPEESRYVGYDFQLARVTDQSERYLSTGYCWRQGVLTNFIALAYPYAGLRYGQQTFPKGGEVLASRFTLEIHTDLPSTEDPNERFQARLFQRYTNALPAVPAMNDLGWIPGQAHLSDFAGPIGVGLFGPGGETTFYQAGTILLQAWQGHQEMPIDTAVHRGDLGTVNYARAQIESLLTNYAVTFTAGTDSCLYWKKPLAGAWLANWGGPAVTTLHNSDGWYPARVLVELYRYDRNHGQAQGFYLQAIDELFNWAKHYVWSRNEFADVPSSPFAIGATLNSAFLLDYYFTFRDDPLRSTNATLALRMADTMTWRYVHPWAMDSDRFDGALDSAFLIEPNSGRDWAGLGCANEVNWNIDAMTQVYVHTGDPRMRYYLRGMLQRWPALYQPNYENSIAEYTTSEALTEGLGVFDGSGPGRGFRYPYGFCPSLPISEPVGASTMRVIAGAQACIAFDKGNTASDVIDYRTGGYGSCSFRIVSNLASPFDVSFSYPFVDISQLAVTRMRNGQIQTLGAGEIVRPAQSPSSLYFSQLQNGDVITIGTVPANAPTISFDNSLVYDELKVQPGTNGSFTEVALTGNLLLPQDWTDLNSFAGLIPGVRWNYGLPYSQSLHALTNVIAANAPGAAVVVTAYSPPSDATLTRSPTLVLDDGTVTPMSGHPALAWRAWPIIFNRTVLLDYAVLPNGRSLGQVDPNGTLLMAVTAFTGSLTDWQPIQDALTNASATFVQDETQELAVLALQQSYAQLPSGRIALLPMNTAGQGANFAAATGLRQKWDALTEQQLVDSNRFNAARYPVAFYLGGENYVKTVLATGDGKAAVTRYLAGGGALIVLASGPFPFYYGYGPADQPGPADPLLPALGMPFQNFEQAPPGIFMERYTNQTILHSVPFQFPFPPGDQRLRAIAGSLVSPANRYVPLIKAMDDKGNNYGDAAVFMAFGTGPAKGGKVLYIWDTLLSGPQGQEIMADTVSWLLNAALRPPPPRFDSVSAMNGGRVAFHIYAKANLDYVIQSGTNLVSGTWTTTQDLSSAPYDRSLWITNTVTATTPRFYRLIVGP